MGNAAVRQRVKASDFHYIAKNTAFLTNEVVEEYFNKYVGAVSRGRIESNDFKTIFRIAFPERPEEKLDLLIKEMEDDEQSIAAGQMMMLLYMFSDGKTDDNLSHMFSLFDEDNSNYICLDELRNLMAFFIEIGEGRNHQVDMATVMAEMFHLGDKDKNMKLDRDEFIKGMGEHPVTSKILRIKKIDELLALM
jgi:Ca2+-binding EF-hand superfamily protein